MPTPYDRVRERYMHDPVFAQAVDLMRRIVLGTQLTPSELREAVVLACCMIEEMTVRPIVIRMKDGEPVDFAKWEEKKNGIEKQSR